MVRRRGKKALYEVIAKSRLKSGYSKTLEQQKEEKPGEDQPNLAEDTAASKPDVMRNWPWRPRIVQLNAGRVEFSIPYQLLIALLLGLLLLFLVVFRLGQNTGSPKSADAETGNREIVQAVPNAPAAKKSVTAAKIQSAAKKTDAVKSKGNNRIVITQYSWQRDLLPVQKHFAAYGIETVIEKRSSGFFLLTKNTYENPQRAGSNGYAVRQKIVKAGAKYKAPENYESFAPRLFSDAYGEKIK